MAIKNPWHDSDQPLTVNGPVVINAKVLLLPLNGSVSAATTDSRVEQGCCRCDEVLVRDRDGFLFTVSRSVDSSMTDTTKSVSGLALAGTYYWRVRRGQS
ncbi:MAG: hypothetical protein IPI01_20750 [Ignavibacteriae bacterium]|nr:hypothetical protein [Ignavibacteriota bacterium]